MKGEIELYNLSFLILKVNLHFKLVKKWFKLVKKWFKLVYGSDFS